MNLVNRLLRKNLSIAQLIGFMLSNFVGLAIVIAAIQFFEDVRELYTSEDSFIKSDYLVVNKRVTSANTLGNNSTSFTPSELEDLERQPWVRSVGAFTPSDYNVMASLSQGGRGMSTYMFFEAVPTKFIDNKDVAWHFDPTTGDVPIILSKDYLTLYNFGFSSSAGLPQLSEGLMGSIPLTLRMTSEDGTRSMTLQGHIAGFSNRLNTILVPEEFMQWSNERLGSGREQSPSRLIVDVSSPGDVAIKDYLASHDLEQAGDKSASQASYLLNVLTGVVLAIGAVITILSLFILMLSISLLIQKNRSKMQQLIMLGYPLARVAAPYRALIAIVCLGAYALALIAVFVLHGSYAEALKGLTGNTHPNLWLAPVIGLALTLLIIAANWIAVGRKVYSARLIQS